MHSFDFAPYPNHIGICTDRSNHSSMVTVAVAGGTGRVGRVIVDALKKSEEHEVIVLTRKVHMDLTDQD